MKRSAGSHPNFHILRCQNPIRSRRESSPPKLTVKRNGNLTMLSMCNASGREKNSLSEGTQKPVGSQKIIPGISSGVIFNSFRVAVSLREGWFRVVLSGRHRQQGARRSSLRPREPPRSPRMLLRRRTGEILLGSVAGESFNRLIPIHRYLKRFNQFIYIH